MSYTVDPRFQTLRDSTIGAELRRGPSGDTWDVTIVITRAPGQPPIDGAEVRASLIDENGVTLPLRLAPSGPLGEAGGSLGMSANARFQFQDFGARLAVLVATVRGAEVRFRLVPA